MTVPPGAAARRTELLDNGTKVLTAPGAAFFGAGRRFTILRSRYGTDQPI